MAKTSNSIIETLLGGFVIAVSAYFVYFAYTSGQAGRSSNGYTVMAKFQRTDGLHVGSDVKVSGVKVGSVLSLEIDPKSYQARATLFINNSIKLPMDSSAAIVSEGLLGGKYISLDPGADSELLADKGIITQTESSVNLETLLNKFLFSKADDSNPKKKP
ncbi:MAG: outer membrane lipid asymmetry maintenance protein MlaD [Pseudomonadota bacterium]